MKPLYNIIVVFLLSAVYLQAQCPSGLAITESTQAGVCGSILTVTGSFTDDAFIEWSTGVSGTAPDGADVTQVGAGLGSPTSYTVTITEPASGCVATTVSADIVTTLPNVMATSTNPTSCQGNDGTITLNATGGPNGFIWSNPAYNNQTSANGLSAGVYGVTVQYNGAMCTIPMVITLQDGFNDFNVLTDQSNDCLADGMDDGEITATATGGTAPYDFDWDDNSLDITDDPDGIVMYTGLAVGVYNATITDANGCMLTRQVTITEAITPEITAINGGPILCEGGAVTLTVAGLNFEGNINTEVKWTLPDGTMMTEIVGNGGRTISGMTQLGTYTVLVTRPNGCSDESTIFISQNDPIIIDGAGSTTSCDGSPTATQTISAVGGTPPYEYDWDLDGVGDFDDMPTSPPFIPTTPFTVVVRDAVGCTQARVFGLGNYIAPNIEIQQTAISCVDGTVELTMIDNGGPDGSPTSFGNSAVITWSEGTTGTLPDGVDIIDVSSTGMYTVTVDKANGCSSMASIEVTSVPDLMAEVTAVTESCQGVNSGAIDVTVTGGTPPYDYDWNNDGSGDFNDPEDLAGLAPNTYMLTVRDADGCNATVMATVGEAATTINIRSVLVGGCQGDSTSILVLVQYTDPPATGSIEVIADGQTKTVPIGPNNPFYVQFNILADGSGAIISASFTDVNCSATSFYLQDIDCTPTAPPCEGDGIGGSLYLDMNNDGIRDPEEYGEAGFQVIVYDQNYNILCTTTTDAFGDFTCPGLTPGEPVIVFVAGNGLTTFAVAGPDNDLNFYHTTVANCDVSIGTVLNPDIALPEDLDFNYEIGDRVWIDKNNSTTQNANEPPLVGVNVNLYDATGNLIGQTVTDGNGLYYFNDSNVTAVGGIMPNTTYYVVFGSMGQYDTGTNILDVGNGSEYELVGLSMGSPTSGSDASLAMGLGFGFDGLPYVEVNFGTTNNHDLDAGFIDICPMVTDLEVVSAGCGVKLELSAMNTVDSTFIEWGNGQSTYSMESPPDIYINESGLYSVTVTNPSGCQDIYEEEITLPNTDGFGMTVSITPACNGNDGGIQINVTGAGGMEVYDWVNDAFDGMSTVTGLAPGVYTVLVQSPGIVTCNNTINILVPDAANILDIEVQDVTCGNKLEVLTHGPFPPGTYFEWSNGQAGYLEDTADDINVNVSGSYTVTVTYPNGCTGTFTKDVNVDPAGPDASVVVVPSCSGANTGSIDITAELPGGTVTYDWDNDAYDGMSTVTDLAPGEYRMVVIYTAGDGSSCGRNTMTLRVEEIPPFSLDISAVGSTGCTTGIGSSIDLEVIDGTAPLTYDWDNDGTGDFDDPQDLMNIPPGTYNVVVRDNFGCEQDTMATIDFIGTDLAIENIMLNNASCGMDNGTIDITIVGGSGNYEYDWDNDGTGDFDDTEDLTGLAGGNYAILVRDMTTGCTATTMLSISEVGSGITLDLAATSFCDINRPGSIDMTIVSSATFPLFSIDWDNDGTGDNDDLEDLSGLDPGTYSVTVTDVASGCMASSSITIEGNDLLATRTFIPSCDDMPFDIDLTINGGVMPYIIDWSNDGTGDFDDSEDLIGLDPTLLIGYTGIVEDAAGCRDTVFVGPYLQGAVNLTTEQIIDCESLETKLVVDGDFLNFTTIEWSTGVTGIRSDGVDTISVAVGATYTVTVTKLNQCSEIGTFVVEPLTDIMLDFTKVDVCDANVSGSIDMTINGGLAPYMIDWNNDGTGDNDDTEDLINLATGIYTVIVTDANGCTGTGMVTIETGPVITDLVVGTDSECGSTNLTVEFTNVQDGAFFEWSNGTAGIYMDPNFPAQPDYVIDQLINTSGTYSVTITNPDGCSTVYTETITIPTSTEFALDVVITPDCGDGNGGAELIASGGSGTYTYNWFDNTYDGQSTVTDLAAGDYYVVVGDGDCLTATLIRIPTGDGFDLDFFVDNECVGDNPFNGNIDLTINGGLAPYTFDWDNDGTGDNDDTEDLTDIAAGTYNVTVTSAEGCTAESSIDVGTQSPQPLIIGSSQICPGDEQLIYLMNVTAGNNIEWNTGVMGMVGVGDTIRITDPGLYTVTVTNPDGCFKTTSISVTPTYQLFVNAISQGCNNELGSVELSIMGDSGPFTIDWDNDGVGDNDDDQDQINLAPGTYNVTVTDSNGCQQTASATVDAFDEIIVGALAIDPLCNGVPGSASVFVGGDGRPPYTFIWSPNAGIPLGANTSIATSLEAGTYSVTVIDNVGCREEASFVLNEPIIEIDVDAIITAAQCFANANDGAIDISVGGGVGPYSFNWSNGATIGDLNDIGVGTYTVTVTDANGCFKESSFEVPGFLDIEVTGITNVCSEDDLSGGIDITVTGGSGNFIYEWDNDGIGDLDDLEDLTGVGPGVYTLNMQDQNLLCTGVISAEVLNVKPEVIIVGDTTICEGQTTTLQALGNIYNGETISWSTGQMGTVATNGDTINVNAVGIYTVITTSADIVACMDTAVIRVVPALEVFITPQNIGCNGELGIIDLQINGDSGPYEIDWDNDGVGDFDDPEDIINLNVGTYNVSVANADGCVVTASGDIEPFDLIANGIVAQDPVCEGIGGVIAVFPGGDGRPPFSFEWSPNVTINPGDNPQLITDLDPGTYIVTVTDANGCEQVESISLSAPTITIDGVANITDSSCSAGNNNGVIDLTASGGSGTYTYQWSNGTTTEDLNGVGTGQYIVTITDFDGCFAVDTFNVAGTFVVEVSNKVDACLSEGSIDISIVGAPPGLVTYDWDNDGTGDFDDPQDLSGLSPGTYTVVVQDNTGCVGTQVVTIDQKEIEVEIMGNPEVCSGSPSTLEVVDINDPLAGDTQITWSTGATGTAGAGFNMITINTPGTYGVTVTTADGCTNEASFIAVPPYEVFIVPENLGCNGELGSIDLSITGESGPYTIDWDVDGVGDADDMEDLENLSPGLYSVTVADANGCSVSETIEIFPFEEIIIGTVELDPLCEGVAGTVGVFAGGDGRAPFTFIWSPNAGVEFGDNVAFINDVGSGTYSVTVIDNNGCREEKEFTLNEPIIELTLDTDITPNTCVAGVEDGEIDLTVLGGAGPYVYNWSNGEMTEDITALPLGSYDLTVTDINGCLANTEINVPGMLNLEVESTEDVCSPTDMTGAINVNVMGGGGTFEYDWDNDGMGDFDDPQNLTNIEEGNYRLVVRDIVSQCRGTIDADIFNLDPDINLIGDTTICGDQVTTLQILGNIVDDEFLEWSTGQSGTLATDADTINVGAIGIYTAIATTTGNTICKDTAVIRVVPALEVFLNPSNLGCNDEPGLIDLQVNGDSGPYLIDWDTDGTGDFDDPEDLTDLSEGTYNVSVVNVDGCVEDATATITPFDLFVNGVVMQDPICDGVNGVIGVFPGGDGRPPFMLQWSSNVTVPPGESGQIIEDLGPGTYIVTATDFNGCMQVDTIVLGEYSRIINTDGVIGEVTCTNNEMNGSIDLSVSDGGGGYSYNWSNGATTEDIDMLTPGEYMVTIVDRDGCIARDTFEIEPALRLESLSIMGDTFICNDGIEKQLTLMGDFGPTDAISWSTGLVGIELTGANVLTITNSGTYSVTVTNGVGCGNSASIEVTDESISGINIEGDGFVCEGVPKELFVTGDFDEDDIIEWNTGVLGTSMTGADTISINSQATYFVTVTNSFGCEATDSKPVFDEGISSIEIQGDTFLCNAMDSKMLTVIGDFDGTATIAWSDGTMGTMASGANEITVNSTGTYSVTITNSFGCETTASVEVTDESFGTISIAGTTAACADDLDQTLTIVGDLDPTDNIVWSDGTMGTMAEGANQIMVTSAGMHSVTVTNGFGCSTMAEITVIDESITSIDIEGDTYLCGDMDSQVLTVTGDFDGTATIAWSNGTMGTMASGANQIMVTTSNSYTVTVTNSTGCTAIAGVLVTDEQINNLNIEGGSGTCTGTMPQMLMVTGDFDDMATIAWSDGTMGTPASGADQINITSPGTYSVTVTNGFGCSSNTSIEVTDNGIMSINIEGDTYLCGNDSQVLTVTGDIDATATITWSDGTMGTIGSGADQITVTAPGMYSVTVMNTSGCTGMMSVMVTDERIASVAIEGNLFLCENDSQDLTVTGDFDDTAMVEWSDGTMGTVASGANQITVTTSGTYSVMVTNSFGCSISTSVVVTDEQINGISIQGMNSSCNASMPQDLTVTGDFDGTANIVWSNGTMGTAASGADQTTITGSGTYSVTVTNSFGCSEMTSIDIMDGGLMSISITGGTSICNSDTEDKVLTVTGDIDATSMITWSDGTMGTIADNANEITITTAGVYSVTVTNGTGCTGMTSITVTDESIASLSIIGDTFLCNGFGSQDLIVTGDFDNAATIVWSNGVMGTVASGANQITVTAPGTYSVVVTNSLGCSANEVITITDEQINSISIEGMNSSCSPSMPQDLTVTGDFDGTANIAWSDGTMGTAASGADQITVTAAGTYSVTVTNTFGCSAMTSVTITDGGLMAIGIEGDTYLCGNDSQVLTVTGDFDNAAMIAWSDGTMGTAGSGANQTTVTMPGTYSVTVTNGTGCTGSISVTVTDEQIDEISIAGTGLGCNAFEPQDLIVTGDFDATANVEWSDGTMGTVASGANQIAIATAGTYSVTVTNTFGCSATTSITIADEGVLSTTIVGNDYLCGDESEVLMVTGNFDMNANITWSDGTMGTAASGANQITITSPGTYNVTVSNAEGCTGTASITVTDEQVNEIAISGGDLGCEGAMPQNLTVTGDIAATSMIAWSDGTMGTIASGADQITISSPGTYSVTVTNSFGCSATTSTMITSQGSLAVSIAGDTYLCGDNDSQELSVRGSFDATATISWSDGTTGTAASGADQITVTTAGTYGVTVTNSTGCSGITSVIVTDEQISGIAINGDDLSCDNGGTGLLTVTGDIDATATIAWSDGTTGTIATGANQIMITSAGTYTVTVTNSVGCTADASIDIVGASGPQILPNITNIGCDGSNGSIELEVIGTGPFMYDWNHLPGDDNPMNITNVPPATYTVIVTDASDCSSTAVIPLIEPTADPKCLPATFTIKPKTANGVGDKKKK